jgi:glutathione peroxidase
MKKKYFFLKRIMIAFIIISVAGFLYVLQVNKNSDMSMTPKQKIMKAAYPVISFFNNAFGNDKITAKNTQNMQAPVSFYDLSIQLNDGSELSFSTLKGKKILLVNTASNCGYTGQYEGLQKLYEENKDNLVVIGFPANDFKEQEKGTDEEIATFCKKNFGVSFPLMKKSSVIKGPNQSKIFEWLTDQSKNGWNSQQPTWNFAKYLIDENGNLTYYFEPTLSPLSKEVIAAIEEN